MNRNRILFAALCAFFVDVGAQAQEPAKAMDSTRTAVKQAVPVLDDRSVKLFLDKIEVEGKLEKPQAVFIIPGVNPEVEDFRLERSFFDDIFRPIEKKGRALVRPQTDAGTRRKDVIPW
jgi:hypothetical protein